MVDCLGLSVTFDDPRGLAAVNEFITREITYAGANLSKLLDAIEVSPGTPLLYIFASICHLYSDSRNASAAAQNQISPLSGMVLNQRERNWLAAIDEWISGNRLQIIKKFLNLLSHSPEDLLAARIAIVHCLLAGDQATMLTIAERILEIPKHRSSAPALSFVSFAYLENWNLEEAERYARAALAIDPHLAWAQHNLAHVFAARDQFEEGIQVLEGHAEDWRGLFIKAHCHWHLAMFYLLTHRFEPALRIYREVLLGMQFWHSVNMINILLMLLYLDLLGYEVSPLVSEELVARMRTREYWGVDGLVDLLTVWALGKYGDKVTARELATMERPKDNEVWNVGCNAMLLLTQNNREDAGKLIASVAEQLKVFGGSNEQRKGFTDACLLTRVGLTAP